MNLNFFYFIFLVVIPVGWWIIYYHSKLSIYQQVYKLESSLEFDLDFVRLSKNILQLVMKETKASMGIIYWYDEVQNKFKLKSLRGISVDKLNQLTQLLSKKSGLLEQVRCSRTDLLIKNINDHPLTKGIAVKELTRVYSSILALPLNTSKEMIGIVVLFKSESYFSKRERRLLNFFAERAAIQLDHSRLYHLATDTALENAKLYVNISKLYHKAILDSLTGLYNRLYLMQKLKEEIKKAYRFRQPLSLIFTDIDLFKQVNDQFGHSTGDQVLSELSDLLRKSIREFDLACRFGGEEFVILLPQTDSENAYLLAERLREITAANLFCAQNLRIRITASFGVSSLSDFDDEAISNLGDEGLNILAENLIAWADEALYRAKNTGRNKVETYEKKFEQLTLLKSLDTTTLFANYRS